MFTSSQRIGVDASGGPKSQIVTHLVLACRLQAKAAQAIFYLLHVMKIATFVAKTAEADLSAYISILRVDQP